MFYTLVGGLSVPCTAAEWGIRRVARAVKANVTVSTVFLGIDHGYRAGLPLLFETMVFGGKHDQWQGRCSTWGQAEKQHKRACKMAFSKKASVLSLKVDRP